jgi:hypothetical protein
MAKITKSMAQEASKKTEDNSKPIFAFGKENYILMLVGVGLIILGFALMTGGGSKDPNVFNEEMFNFRRITLAPILILIGFGVEIVAIMKRPKD